MDMVGIGQNESQYDRCTHYPGTNICMLMRVFHYSPEAMEDMFDITEESNGPAPNLPPKIEMNHLQR